MFNKIILISLLSVSFTPAFWAYTSVECSTNPTFWENSCNQCFDGGEVKVGDVLSFLDDAWNNSSENKKIMYKEEQKMPILLPLNGAKFSKKPNDDTFWKYTPAFEALQNKEFDGYVLSAWGKITWLQSSEWAGYQLDTLPTQSGNAWILVFDIMAHTISSSWEIDMNNTVHKECVLYKAWAPVMETPVVEETPIEKVTPQPQAEDMIKVKTWPENYLFVLLFSFLVGMLFMNRKMILQRVKK